MAISTSPATPATLSLFPPRGAAVPGASSEGHGRDGSSTRDQLLELTMREVAKVGPAAFNTRTVCAELEIAHPMVHYYFGSRDGLIAEAAHVLYARYVDLVWAAAETAPRVPIERLRAFLQAGLRLSVEMRGWGAVLNYYSFYSSAMADIVAERHQQDHVALYARNLAMVAQLVADVWDDHVTDGAPQSATLEPRPELDVIAGLMFSLHGLTVWRAGHVVPLDEVPQAEELADQLAAAHLENVVSLIAASRPSDRVPRQEGR
jgi:AcrR family transcriptional regulator